jgi:uncharacterized membrane protein YfcA
MTYSLDQLATIAVVMTFGSVLQGAVGFASGLIGVPLLVLCGFSLLEATVVNFISTGVQNTLGAIQLWGHLRPRDVAAPALLRCVGLPLGLQTLSLVQRLDQSQVKQVIGLVLLATVALMIGFRVSPRPKLPAAWTVLAFVTSGFLMGFASIGGAPMVLYVNALTWSAAKSRGFLFFCSAALVPLMGLLLMWKFGAEAAQPAMVAIIIMPPVLVGLWAGLKLGHQLDKARFRRLTYVLLVAVSLAAIFGPMVV